MRISWLNFRTPRIGSLARGVAWLTALFGFLTAVGGTALLAQRSVRGSAEEWGRLRVTIVDSATGEPVSARCYLTDPTRQSWSPAGALNYVKPPERHFIAEGEFQIALPARVYTLVVERGPEYRAVRREIVIASSTVRRERILLQRWINMNERGWFSGDLHNHRDWREVPLLLEAEDLNLAPTLTHWVWEDRLISRAPNHNSKTGPVRDLDGARAYSIVDTEIERLRDGPGAINLLGLAAPVDFGGHLLWPPSSVYTEAARKVAGYVDAEKITWRDAAALVALGQVDFAGIVHNHFNRHGVETETREWGMIPRSKPEFETAAGMPLWTLDVYYKFLNCGFGLPVSAGSASGVKPNPLGYNRVYVRLPGEFSYREWFAGLKEGRSFATNGPMLQLAVNGQGPGETISIPAGRSRRLRVRAEASTARELDRLEIVWKGRVVGSAKPQSDSLRLEVEFEFNVTESGWFAARAFERPLEGARFAHTSPVYVRVGRDAGVVPEDAMFFLEWTDREIRFYENLAGFRTESERQEMLDFFRRGRAVYQRLLGTASGAGTK